MVCDNVKQELLSLFKDNRHQYVKHLIEQKSYNRIRLLLEDSLDNTPSNELLLNTYNSFMEEYVEYLDNN